MRLEIKWLSSDLGYSHNRSLLRLINVITRHRKLSAFGCPNARTSSSNPTACSSVVMLSCVDTGLLSGPYSSRWNIHKIQKCKEKTRKVPECSSETLEAMYQTAASSNLPTLVPHNTNRHIPLLLSSPSLDFPTYVPRPSTKPLHPFLYYHCSFSSISFPVLPVFHATSPLNSFVFLDAIFFFEWRGGFFYFHVHKTFLLFCRHSFSKRGHAVCNHYLFKYTYLLTYLLHGAESFLRS